LGSAKKITVTKTSTTIIGGYGKKEDIQNRILQIKNDINHCDSAYDVEKMQDRMSKLTGGAGVIFVGGVTEIELKEKKDRVEDAIFATKAAVLEGIVAGGGVALLRCQDVVQELVDSISDRGEREGAKIILNVLEIPTKTIVKNAGGKPDVVIDTIMKSDNPNFGYNAATGQYEDLVESGIIDPKKVVRCAIQNAASVASMLITTEAMIVDEEVKKENKDG
jgi:chaperonin GroEL